MATLTLRPNGNGSTTSIPVQYPASDNHYDKVDEVTTDNDSTYVATNSDAESTDLYDVNTSTPSTDYGPISSVVVYYRCRRTVASGEYVVQPTIGTHSTTYDGSNGTLTDNNYILNSYTWNTNPNTSNAWTWAEIDALEIGVTLAGDSKKRSQTRCTQVYAIVNYTRQWTGTINGIENPEEINGVDTENIYKVNGIVPQRD